jgi:hypothetical protein
MGGWKRRKKELGRERVRNSEDGPYILGGAGGR